MVQSLVYSPPYSMVVISEPGRADIPDPPRGSIVAASAHCITVGCRSEDDGVTEFSFGNLEEVDIGTSPDLSAILLTPSRVLAIRTAHNEIIMSMNVSSEQTRVNVWINDAIEPDKVVIGVESA